MHFAQKATKETKSKKPGRIFFLGCLGCLLFQNKSGSIGSTSAFIRAIRGKKACLY
jgi:hypothetical protein